MHVYIIKDGTNLFPDHIYDWKISGINCASDDFSIGNVSQVLIEFKTDVVFSVGDTFSITSPNVDAIYATVIEVVKNNTAQITYNIKARMGILDIDAILPDSFTEDIAEAEGFTLTNLVNKLAEEEYIDAAPTLPINGNYEINTQFGYTGLTVRQLLQWIGQLCGFSIEAFETHAIPNNNRVLCFQPYSVVSPLAFTDTNIKKIDIAEYTVPQIDRIWFGTDNSDVGVSYGSGTEQLSMPYNPLIDGDTFIQPLYNRVHSLQAYTPMKIETFTSAENIIYSWTDLLEQQWMTYTKNNTTYSCPIFNWEISPSGIVLEGTGNYSRTASNSLISSEIAQNGKYNKFKRTLDGTVSEVANLSGQVSTISQTAASLTLEVADKVGYDEVISSINQTAETITIDADKISLNGAVEVGPSDRHPEAFLTILPSAEDLTGQHSKVQLFNNSIKVHTYDVNNNEIAYSAMEGSGFGQHGITTTNGNRVDYANVYIFSNAANELNPAGVGYGDIRLYNGKWLQDHGITTTANQGGSVRLAAGNSSEPGGVLQLFDINASGNPSLNARLDASSYGQLVLGNGGGYSGVQATSDTRGVILLRSTSATYPYAYYENSKLQVYGSAATSTLLNPNGVTAYGSTTNLTSLTKDGILVYGDNGSGTAATKGRYSGDLLTVGVAASGTTYTYVSPTTITWYNSGQNPVNKLIPQGASVIEHGTKTVGGNTWSYRKWSNGDYECWIAVHYNTQTNHTFGNQYYAEIAAITYPITFLEAPKEVVSVEGGTQTSSQNISVYLSNASPGTSTTKSGAYLVMRPTNSVVDFWIDYYAKGTVAL